MAPHVPLKQSKNTPETLRILDRFFAGIERFAYNHSFPVILVSCVLAGLSIWVTLNYLTFNTARGDLVAKDMPYVVNYQKYRDAFEDYEGMIVVVEDDTPEKMKAFTEALVRKFEKHPETFSDIFYRIETSYFQDRALLYLDMEELADLGKKIRSHEKFMGELNASPGLNQLMKSINGEISTGMVDTLLSDFLGTAEEEKKDEVADLSLLINLLKQMTAHVKEETPPFRSPWQSFLTQREENLKEEGYLVSGDDSLLYILVVPRQDESVFTSFKDSVQFSRRLIKETEDEFPGIRVGLTGEDVISTDEMVTTQKDVRRASLLALTGVVLLFIAAFRGMVKPLLAVFCLVVALCWSMGFTTLTVGHLNILSVVFTTILIGLGIDFGIHILERYREERTAGLDVFPALEKTVQGTGRGNFAGAVTTAMAFGAMTLTDFIGIAELGWIAAGGILLCMLSMLLLLPALIRVEEKWRTLDYSKTSGAPGDHPWVKRVFDRYREIIVVSVVLVAAAAFSLKDVRFDYNLLHLQAKGTEAVRYEMKIIESAHRSAWSAAILADSLEEAIRKHKALEKLPTVQEVESIVSTLPENQEEKIQYLEQLAPLFDSIRVREFDEPFSLPELKETLKKIRFKLQGREDKKGEPGSVQEASFWVKRFMETLENADPERATRRLAAYSHRLFEDYREKIAELKSNARPSPVRVEELPKNLKERFISQNGKYLLSVYPRVNIWEREAREKFMDQLQSIDPNVTGNAMHMFKSSELMKQGYIHGGIYAMIAIVLYVLITFKKIRTTLLVLLPVGVGSIWTLGVMDLLGISFNLANLVILPLIIGIGVVNGIHIVHRYREERDKDIPVLSKSTGDAVVLSSLTTMIGFGSLMVADHQGIFSLGLVLTIGVGCCLVASVSFLPAMLKLATRKGWDI